MPVAPPVRLPLFPYAIVAFPSIPCPLRFFEERYKQMCEDVIGTSDEFGIILAKVESRFEAEVPEAVGTIVRVDDHVRMADGQWIVSCVGVRRFRVIDIGPRIPYLTADVGAMDESVGDELRCDALRDSASLKLRRLSALRTEAGLPALPVVFELARHGATASYQLAALMGLEPATQQRLLEIEHADDRLAAEIVLLDLTIGEVEDVLGGN